MIRMTVLTASATFAAALMIPAGASAKTVPCDGTTYGGVSDSFPGVAKIRAHNLPGKTDGYAPRCLVAESVAGRVQMEMGDGEAPFYPKRVRVYGARWDGGTWKMRYRQVTVTTPEGDDWTYEAVTGRKVGKPRQRITFRLTS